jgi:hypothetical protein
MNELDNAEQEKQMLSPATLLKAFKTLQTFKDFLAEYQNS